MLLVKRDEISVRNSSLKLETGCINFSLKGEYIEERSLKKPHEGKDLSAR